MHLDQSRPRQKQGHDPFSTHAPVEPDGLLGWASAISNRNRSECRFLGPEANSGAADVELGATSPKLLRCAPSGLWPGGVR